MMCFHHAALLFLRTSVEKVQTEVGLPVRELKLPHCPQSVAATLAALPSMWLIPELHLNSFAPHAHSLLTLVGCVM